MIVQFSRSIVFINRCFTIYIVNYKIEVAIIIKIAIGGAIADERIFWCSIHLYGMDE